MFKLGYYRNNREQEYHYSDIYNIEQTGSYERIVVGLAQNYIDTVLDLMAVLSEPFYVLYVLHTPRTNIDPGRYQSEALTYEETGKLLNRFKSFFENDSRHDIWVHSPKTNTTIVYDRHNRIYLYGFTDQHLALLKGRGLKKDAISVPLPHIHCYNAENDGFETNLINEYQWTKTPLHDEDCQ